MVPSLLLQGVGTAVLTNSKCCALLTQLPSMRRTTKPNCRRPRQVVRQLPVSYMMWFGSNGHIIVFGSNGHTAMHCSSNELLGSNIAVIAVK